MNQIAQIATTPSTFQMQGLKPKRSNYKKTFIIDGAGKLVDPEVWAGMIKGHHAAVVLKKNGFHRESIFLEDQYESVKTAYYAIKHDAEKRFNDDLIGAAFSHLGVPKTKRVERVLRSIMPLIKSKPTDEKIARIESVISTFRQIAH